jgi:hypothetical protein
VDRKKSFGAPIVILLLFTLGGCSGKTADTIVALKCTGQSHLKMFSPFGDNEMTEPITVRFVANTETKSLHRWFDESVRSDEEFVNFCRGECQTTVDDSRIYGTTSWRELSHGAAMEMSNSFNLDRVTGAGEFRMTIDLARSRSLAEAKLKCSRIEPPANLKTVL